MAEEVVKSVAEELNCSICMNRFSVPKMLDCIHSFCEGCLENYMKKLNGKEMSCPMCRKVCPLPSGIKGLQTNIYLVNLCEKIDLYEKLKPSNVASKMCESCKKSTKVTAYCIDCRYAICNSCEEQHSFFPALQSHSLEKIGKVDQNKLRNIQQNTLVPSCDLHPPEKLRFFCKTCSKLICRECTVVQHPKPEHLLVEAPTQFEEVKSTLSKLLKESPAEVQFVTSYVKDGKSGQNEIKTESETLSKELQDWFTEVKSEITSQIGKQLKESLSNLHKTLESKESNIEESITVANDWLERMDSTQNTTEKVIQESNMWELLAMSNNLISSFQTLSNDKSEFQWDVPDFNLEMVFTPSEMPRIRLGQLCSTNDPYTFMCGYAGTFMKYHFDQEKSLIERTRVKFTSNSFTENKLPVIPIQIKIQDGSVRFSASCNCSYSIFGINQYMLAVRLDMNPYYSLFSFRDRNTSIQSVAISDNCLCLMFCKEPSIVYYDTNAIKYFSQHQQQSTEVLRLESLSQVYPNALSCCICSMNIKHISLKSSNEYFLATTENSETLVQYEFLQKARCDIKVAAPASHQSLQILSLLNISETNPGSTEREGVVNGLHTRVNMQNFVCYILWASKIATKGIPGRKQQLIITRYESLNDQNTHTWDVPLEMGIPRACFWNAGSNVLKVYNSWGNVVSLE